MRETFFDRWGGYIFGGIIAFVLIGTAWFVYDRVMNFETVELQDVTVIDKDYEPAHTVNEVIMVPTGTNGGMRPQPTTRHVPDDWDIKVRGISPITYNVHERWIDVSENIYNDYEVEDEYDRRAVTVRERINNEGERNAYR